MGEMTHDIDTDGRYRVVVSSDGTDARFAPVTPAAVEVTKLDAAGNALPGACFAVLDQRGVLTGQACDGDDGADDGLITIGFPNGVPAGSYLLRQTADGGVPIADQSVDLSEGTVQVEARAES
jgi:hypothetical protein